MQFLIDDNRTNHMEAKQDKNVKKTSRGNMPRFAKNDSNGNQIPTSSMDENRQKNGPDSGVYFSQFKSNYSDESSSARNHLNSGGHPIAKNSSSEFTSQDRGKNMYPYPLFGTNNTLTRGFTMLDQQTEEELLNFTRKLFSFLALQMMSMTFLATVAWNSYDITVFIKHYYGIFIAAVIICLVTMVAIYWAFEYVRKQPWSSLLYLAFSLSEAWVIGYLTSITDQKTVFLFSVMLASNVVAISIFISTQEYLNWKRGIFALGLMGATTFSVSVVMLSSVDVITILLCLSGGIFFGIYLLSKMFQMMEGKYTIPLRQDDYLIGSLSIYVDFGFVLLLILFVMLAMIKSFVSYETEDV